MAKLIYTNEEASSLLSSSLYQANGAYYRSVAFTADGHIITHGIDFCNVSNLITDASFTTGASDQLILSIQVTTNNNVTTKTLSWINRPSLTLNGTNKDLSTNPPSFYAPTASGTAGLILRSLGSNKAPAWEALISDADKIDLTTNNNKVATIEAIRNYVTSYVAEQSTSLLNWKGDTSNASVTPTKIGDAWRASGSFTLSAANSATGQDEILENGDIMICTQLPDSTTNPVTVAKYAVIQTNWSITTPASDDLAWGSSVTLATVGGVNITAELPSAPSYAAVDGISDAANKKKIGTLSIPGASTSSYDIYTYDSVHSFYVGASLAKADAVVTSGNAIYLTTKNNSLAASAAGTNILGIVAGNGLKIENSNNNKKLITFSRNAIVSSYTKQASLGNNYTEVNAGTITIDGTELQLKSQYLNTWRPILGYLNVTDANSATRTLKTDFGSGNLTFMDSFSCEETGGNLQVDLCWLEINKSGNTYTYTYV